MNPEWQHLANLDTGSETVAGVAGRQESWLLDCLHRNRATRYGEQYRFDEIHSISEFRERVPIIQYDDIESHILRMSDGEADVLFAGHPIAFERTGGSTGGCRLIPYSQHSLADFQSALLPWLSSSIKRFGIESGAAYISISPATRQSEASAGGAPIGLPDGAYLGAEALFSFAQVSAVPVWVGNLINVAEWQLATLYWLIRRDDLAMISVWSPTFMLTLMEALDSRGEELADLLQRGGILSGHELAADAGAHARLGQFISDGDSSCLWPDLKLVSCWADASSKPFYEQLKHRLPHATFQGKGLLSTEAVVTVPDSTGQPVLTLDSGFFEFLPAGGNPCLGDEVSDGEQYEVILTTSGGLYRYRTGDCVICEGFVDDVPVLRFSGRIGLTCDIVGEKLHESFVLSCLEDIPGFCMLVPVSTPRSRYVLILDKDYEHESNALIDFVETRLFRNPQYAYARNIGQLDRLECYEGSRPLHKYTQRLAAAGARLGDLKVTALRPETDWLDTFSVASG